MHKALCYRKLLPRALDRVTKECFLLPAHFLGNYLQTCQSQRTAGVHWGLHTWNTWTSLMSFWHSYFLSRKQKIWERGTACLWCLGSPDTRPPRRSSCRNQAGTVSRSSSVLTGLLTSQWVASLSARAGPHSLCLGALPSPLFHHISFFSAFLPFIHHPLS